MRTSVTCPKCGSRCDVSGEQMIYCPHCREVISVSVQVADPRETDSVSEVAKDEVANGEATTSMRDHSVDETKYNAPRTSEVDAGPRFGDYELITHIAQGGMGVVYKARHVKLNRLVALKMIRSGGLASQQEVQRFFSEASAAAVLDHPGIVPIFEFGEQDGQQFFTMAFVEGQSLAARVADGPLPPREAAEMVQQIADAIDYAHRQGVLHRDLKPANILLDREGRPKVADFGLAKQLQGDSDLTSTGQILGTPSYMPPEQAKGALDQISPAADVYSLGAILYCLLSGKPPFQAASVAEVIRLVLEADPVPLRQLNPSVPRDLETIAMMCLEKERGKRYASAGELAEELDRYLNGLPIVARPVSSLGRIRRFAWRQPVIASLLVIVMVTLLTGSIISSYFWREATLRFEEARASALDAEHAEEKAKAAEIEERKQRIKAEEQTTLANEREQQAIRRKEEAEREARHSMAMRLAAVSRNERSKSPAVATLLGVEAVEATRQDGITLPFAEQALRDALSSIRYHTLTGQDGKIKTADISPNDRWMATGASDEKIRLWDLSRVPNELECHLVHKHPVGVKHLEFTPNGRWLVAVGTDGSISLYPLDDDQLLQAPAVSLPRQHKKVAIEIAGGGDWLVTHNRRFKDDHDRWHEGDGIVRFWNLIDPVAGQSPVVLDCELPVYRMALSPDGIRLITLHAVKASHVAKEGTIWEPGREPQLAKVKNRPTGKDLKSELELIASEWREVTWSNLNIWDLTEFPPQRIRRLPAVHQSEFADVACSPDGRWLLTNGPQDLNDRGEVLRYWDLTRSNPRPVTLLDPADSLMGPIHASSNGKRAAFSTMDNVFLVDFRSDAVPRLTALNPPERVTWAWLSPDDRQLIAITMDGPLLTWDLTKKHPAHAPKLVPAAPDSVTSLHFSSNANTLVTTGEYDVQYWNLRFDPVASPRILRNVPTSFVAGETKFSSDGRYLGAKGGAAGLLFIWDLASSESEPSIRFARNCYAYQFSPDSAWLALNGANEFTTESFKGATSVELWHLPSMEKKVFSTGKGNTATALAFSKDQHWLAAGTASGKVLVRDLRDPTTDEWQRLAPHATSVALLTFAPHAKRLVSIEKSGVCHVYDRADDGESWDLRVIPSRDNYSFYTGVVSPNGRWVYRKLHYSKKNLAVAYLFDLSHPEFTKYGSLPFPIHRGASDFSKNSDAFITSGRERVWIYWLSRPNPLENPSTFGSDSLGIYVRTRFLQDDRILTFDPTGFARIWDLQQLGSPIELSHLSRQSKTPFEYGVVCPHGRYAAIPREDGELHVYALDVSELVRLARKTVGRKLSASERRLYSLPKE